MLKKTEKYAHPVTGELVCPSSGMEGVLIKHRFPAYLIVGLLRYPPRFTPPLNYGRFLFQAHYGDVRSPAFSFNWHQAAHFHVRLFDMGASFGY